MNRRTFIATVLYGVLAEPSTAQTQTASRVRRIGWLGAGKTDPEVIRQMVNELSTRGWIEGQDLRIEQRYTDAEALLPLAQELARLKVDLIVTDGTTAALTAKQATTSVPIVMFSAGDPIGVGLVSNLVRPGGNITGYALLSPQMDAKRLSVLHELLPATQRVAELMNSTNRYLRDARPRLEEAYQSLGMKPIFVDIVQFATPEAAVAEAARLGAQAVHLRYTAVGDLMVGNVIEVIESVMRTTLRYRLPAIVNEEALLEAGGLLSYNHDGSDMVARVASFIDRILRGAKPGDLPIEQPTKFVLGINLKTAKALAITVPKSLLVRADFIIQ